MGFSEAPIDLIELQTGAEDQQPTASVIWLHGLGADGNDFVPIVPELELPDGIRFIFPHAPTRPITINNGYMMRGWFDLSSLELQDNEDVPGIRNSVEALTALVQREIQGGIPAERIFLVGFSQGGAIALYTGMTIEEPIGGIMALSTWLPIVEEAKANKTDRRPPIFMAHGTQDDVVKYDYGRQTADLLTEWGYTVDWHDYSMPHSVCREEIDDMAQWFKAQLG